MLMEDLDIPTRFLTRVLILATLNVKGITCVVSITYGLVN